MNLTLLVIRSAIPEKLAEFYERLGLTFEHHRHGKGPYHFSAQIGPTLLEIYPLAKGQASPDTHLRLGLAVYAFEGIIHELQQQGISLHQPPMFTEWGIMAVVEDPEGRKVELYEKYETKEAPVWHLVNTSFNAVSLYQSDNSHYIVTQDGKWTPIISCGLYIIINQPLLSFFQQHLDVPLISHAVSIYDRELNQYFEGYHRIYIENQISPDTQNTVDHTGMKVWCHESSGGIFISPLLKSAMEDSNIERLRTNPGFSLYGGTT